MASTFATRLATSDGTDLRLYFTIEGVPYVFQEDATEVPTTFESSARPRVRGVVGIDQGETRLNIKELRPEGGGLTVDLVDDDDGTLRALFTPRRARRNFVRTTGLDETDDVIEVYSTSWVSSYTLIANTIYIDSESIVYGGTTSDTFTGCTRGAWDSEATAHYGATTDGAAIFFTPPHWAGRRVKLYGYFLNDDGTTTTDLRSQLGVFVVQAAPENQGDDRWRLECTELSDEFAIKKIATGIVDVKPENPEYQEGPAEGTTTIQVGAGHSYNQFVQSATLRTLVLIKEGTRYVIKALASRIDDSDDDKIALFTAGSFATNEAGDVTVGTSPVSGGSGGAQSIRLESLRHIIVLTDAQKDMLRVLTSRTGNVENGSYDELPGYARITFGEPAWRFGAGIRSAEVDAVGIAALLTNLEAWTYPLVEEETLAEFLADFCFRFGFYWYVSKAGKLSMDVLSDKASDSVLTIDDDVLLEGAAVKVRFLEEDITPRLRLECNYDPISRKHMTVLNAHDTELSARYPHRDDTHSIKSKSIIIEGARRGEDQEVQGLVTISRAAAEQMCRRRQVAGGRGTVVVEMQCALTALELDIGDIVTLDIDNTPDLEGGSALSGKTARVVGIRPRYDDGAVDLRVQLIDRLFFIAPACIIQSASSDTLTLRAYDAATYPEGVSAPGRMFAEDWNVLLYDVSGAAFENAVVVSVTDTTVQLTGAPSMTVQNDVDVIMVDAFGLVGSGENGLGFEPDDFIFQMADNEFAVEDAGLTVTRWR